MSRIAIIVAAGAMGVLSVVLTAVVLRVFGSGEPFASRIIDTNAWFGLTLISIGILFVALIFWLLSRR